MGVATSDGKLPKFLWNRFRFWNRFLNFFGSSSGSETGSGTGNSSPWLPAT